jgi:hypothetical protein
MSAFTFLRYVEHAGLVSMAEPFIDILSSVQLAQTCLFMRDHRQDTQSRVQSILQAIFRFIPGGDDNRAKRGFLAACPVDPRVSRLILSTLQHSGWRQLKYISQSALLSGDGARAMAAGMVVPGPTGAICLANPHRGGLHTTEVDHFTHSTVLVLCSPQGRAAVQEGILRMGTTVDGNVCTEDGNPMSHSTLRVVVSPFGREALAEGVISLAESRHGGLCTLDGQHMNASTLEVVVSPEGRLAIRKGYIDLATAKRGYLRVSTGALSPETLRIVISPGGQAAVASGLISLSHVRYGDLWSRDWRRLRPPLLQRIVRQQCVTSGIQRLGAPCTPCRDNKRKSCQ